MSHQLYTDADKDAPDVIKDNRGQVVLGLCKVCGKGEIELNGPCEPRANKRKARNCDACHATGNEPGGGYAIPCSRCNGRGWIAINFEQPLAYSPAGEKPEIVTEVTTAKVSLKDLEEALCASLAWGRAYGPVINRHQWEEMRDTQIRQHMAKLLSLTVEQVQLQHRCQLPDRPGMSNYVLCPDCNQAWKWNGTGWYKSA